MSSWSSDVIVTSRNCGNLLNCLKIHIFDKVLFVLSDNVTTVHPL